MTRITRIAARAVPRDPPNQGKPADAAFPQGIRPYVAREVALEQMGMTLVEAAEFARKSLEQNSEQTRRCRAATAFSFHALTQLESALIEKRAALMKGNK